MVQDVRAGSGQPVDAGEAMRLATALGQTLDQLLIEKVGPEKLRELNVSGDLSDHWNKSLELFNILFERWPRELAARALIDMAERRSEEQTSGLQSLIRTPYDVFCLKKKNKVK